MPGWSQGGAIASPAPPVATPLLEGAPYNVEPQLRRCPNDHRVSPLLVLEPKARWSIETTFPIRGGSRKH